MNKAPRGQKWDKAQTIAAHVMMDLNERKTAGATHYHATYVNPVWNSGLIKTKKIGTHIFYRFPRGSEWSVASARQSARLAQRRAGYQAIKPAATSADAKPEVLKPETVADLNARSLQTIQSAVAVETTAVPATNLETGEAAITSASIETAAPASANSAL